MTALDDLIAAVDAGTWDYRLCMAALPKIQGGRGSRRLEGFGKSAFGGSLDAAKALHDALLPGWEGDFDTAGFSQVYEDEKEVTSAQAALIPGNPARAWLLAILRAVKAQQEGAK